MSTPIRKLLLANRMKFPGSLALLFIFGLLPALAEMNAPQNPTPAVVGDAPANLPPLAKDLSPRLKRSDIERALRKVADWQLERARTHFDKDWTYAALYAGFMAVPSAVAGSRYQNAMLDMSKSFAWQLGPRVAHA
ncbi:MAG: unsaturated rhamnogalacturonyl hydrolase, partial [Acidobacteriaceae bacterium]|nr:unsaturated rhamnogalacturonyl hydrolase [Acidobacteriaceae bacterium]